MTFRLEPYSLFSPKESLLSLELLEEMYRSSSAGSILVAEPQNGNSNAIEDIANSNAREDIFTTSELPQSVGHKENEISTETRFHNTMIRNSPLQRVQGDTPSPLGTNLSPQGGTLGGVEIESTHEENWIMEGKNFESERENCPIFPENTENYFDEECENVLNSLTQQKYSNCEEKYEHFTENLEKKSSENCSSEKNEEILNQNMGNCFEEELSFLKKIKEETFAEINCLNSQKSNSSYENNEICENSKMKENRIQEKLEFLFSRMESIISEVEAKNNIVQRNVSQMPRILEIVPQVFSVNVEAQRPKEIQEDEIIESKNDLILQSSSNHSENGDEDLRRSVRSEFESIQTPCSGSRFKKQNMLILSKHLPYQESISILNSLRSSRSRSRTKGIALVSAEKNREKSKDKDKKSEEKDKQCLKVTLVNRKNSQKVTHKKGCNKNENSKNEKSERTDRNEKKNTVFNPANFFSSKRVSTKIF